MSREDETLRMSINTAQPTDVLTAQPDHGRVLTETVQPQGFPDNNIPLMISGVAPVPNQPAVPSAPAPSPEPSGTGSE